MTKIDFCKALEVSKISTVRLKLEIGLLTNTKPPKYPPQHLLITHLPRDLSQILQTTPDIQGQ